MNYFDISDFNCPCCGDNKMEKEFLDKIDLARALAGVPFIITSGYRCKKHNVDVGGSVTSSHVDGEAGDIKAKNSRARSKIVRGLHSAGFRRIGIAGDFIHADISKFKSQDVLWRY